MTIDLGTYSYHQESRNSAKCKACHSKSLRDQLYVSDLIWPLKIQEWSLNPEVIYIYIYIYIYILREIFPFPFKHTAPPQPEVRMIALASIREYILYDVITLWSDVTWKNCFIQKSAKNLPYATENFSTIKQMMQQPSWKFSKGGNSSSSARANVP